MMIFVDLSGTAARSSSTNLVLGVMPASEKKKTGMFTEPSTWPAANSSSVLGREEDETRGESAPALCEKVFRFQDTSSSPAVDELPAVRLKELEGLRGLHVAHVPVRRRASEARDRSSKGRKPAPSEWRGSHCIVH